MVDNKHVYIKSLAWIAPKMHIPIGSFFNFVAALYLIPVCFIQCLFSLVTKCIQYLLEINILYKMWDLYIDVSNFSPRIKMARF